MKKVMVFGTFDILHVGHLFFLKKAKEFGDYLIVVISRDKNAEKIKGKKLVHNENDRLELIKSIKTVDEAILGNEGDFYLGIEKYSPNVIVLGYDQIMSEVEIKKELEKRNLNIPVHRLTAFNEEIHKTSKIKKRIIENGDI